MNVATSLDAVVVGGAAVDWVARVERLPQRDGIALARSCEQVPGGSAANVAVGLARLGYRVGFVGRLGDDERGRLLLAAFEDEGVDTQAVIVARGHPTAACFIAVDDRGERTIVGLPGASILERPEEVDREYLRGARVVYLGPSYTDVALVVAEAVDESGGTVFYAPGGVPGPAGPESLRPLLAQVEALIVSRADAVAWLGEADPDGAARALQEMGARVVVETLGAEGALVARGAELCRVPAPKVSDARDTTGAGDAFAAGLIAGFLEGLDWEAAARTGCMAAALKIRHVGARSGLPSRAELDAALVAPRPVWSPGD